MNDVQEIDVDELMAQIRQHAATQQCAPSVSAIIPSSNDLAAAELVALQSNREIRYFHLISHRKFLGLFAIFAKKLVRKLLTPSLERQSEYNTANIRMVAHLREDVETLQRMSGELVEQLRGIRQVLGAELRKDLQQIEERCQELGEQIGGVHQEQAAGLQAVRGEVAEQIGEVRQEQAAGLQAVRGEVVEQIGEVRQEQAADLQAIRAELTGQLAGVHQEQAAGFHALRSQIVEEIAEVHRKHTVALQETRERSSRAERRVRRFVSALTDGPNAGAFEVKQPLSSPKAVLDGNPGSSFDYFGFEERFRGSEEDIKERHRAYIECFQEANLVLDIGCGRGEFLELLTEAGIKAKGVDLDLDMVLYCQEKGLDVIREDAFIYVASLPDESLSGLFAAQLVEHLEPTRIIELVNLCQRKLQPGGVLIFETPNPTCLTVFARSFYMDFSHIRPIHPEAMRFLFESAGFHDLQVKLSSPVESSMRIPSLPGIAADAQMTEEFNRGIERLNELLYGFQDYAVIGRKSPN